MFGDWFGGAKKRRPRKSNPGGWVVRVRDPNGTWFFTGLSRAARVKREARVFRTLPQAQSVAARMNDTGRGYLVAEVVTLGGGRLSNPRKPRVRAKSGKFLPGRCTRGTKQGWRARRVKGPGKYAPGSCRKHPSRPAPRRGRAR